MCKQYLLTDKTYIVTGASSGIGRSTAITLSELGARIIAVGRDSDRIAATMENLKGTENHSFEWDLTDTDLIPKRILSIAEEHGSLDGIVHAAGIQLIKPVQLYRHSDLEKTMSINVGAALALARAYKQRAVLKNGGALVFISSVVASAGQPGTTLYAASKGALSAATRSLALEFSRDNVRVNSIAPAMVTTEMTNAMTATLPPDALQAIRNQHPLGFGTPEDVANACGFLLSSAARWITGTTLVVDGGYLAH